MKKNVITKRYLEKSLQWDRGSGITQIILGLDKDYWEGEYLGEEFSNKATN